MKVPVALCLLVHYFQSCVAAAVWQPIKLVSGTPAPVPTPVPQVTPARLREPSALSGPLAIQTLFGRCFMTKERVYEYTFCPFSNVTQRDVSGAWNAFFGILGVWDAWLPAEGGDDDTALTQIYSDGTPCGFKRRLSKVYFSCADSHRISSVSEPATCEYRFNFEAPEVCAGFKANLSELLRIKLLSEGAASEETLSQSASTTLSAAPSLSSTSADSTRLPSSTSQGSSSPRAQISCSQTQAASSTLASASNSATLKDSSTQTRVMSPSATMTATLSLKVAMDLSGRGDQTASISTAGTGQVVSELSKDKNSPADPSNPPENSADAIIRLLDAQAIRMSRIERKIDQLMEARIVAATAIASVLDE